MKACPRNIVYFDPKSFYVMLDKERKQHVMHINLTGLTIFVDIFTNVNLTLQESLADPCSSSNMLQNKDATHKNSSTRYLQW